MGRGAWWAAVHGVAKSQTWLSNWARMLTQFLICKFDTVIPIASHVGGKHNWNTAHENSWPELALWAFDLCNTLDLVLRMAPHKCLVFSWAPEPTNYVAGHSHGRVGTQITMRDLVILQLICGHVLCVLNHVQPFATPQTVACQAPPFMGFPRQEYWSGLPFPPPGYLLHPGIEPPYLLHCRRILYLLSHQGSPDLCTHTYLMILALCLAHKDMSV